ncbi:MAG: thioredoxin domain-containing protein [Kofleriaceae bacterium]|nr:thioredoxin domain-containing protein [Kofleriaceae bacterium]
MRFCAFSLSILLACAIPGACGGKRKKVQEEPVSEPTSQHLPGAEAYSAHLVEELRAATLAKGPDYKPRTRHLNSNGSATYTNRLAKEPSPYLQQHAHNPVNWYPWGDEAFEAAKRLDRPVLLSIGYSTCHWCHVMEEESFEDEETARFLNENYIAIKVDREERPDVDSIYMTALHAMGQSGGWPLNVWLTPDRKPFYGGTYFPPEDGRGRPAFVTILGKLKTAFDTDREGLLKASSEVVAQIEQMAKPVAGSTDIPGEEVLSLAATHYASAFDSVHGGRKAGGRGNKFPSSMPVRFLLRHYRRSGDKKFLDMAILTLDKMAAGGMYDQAAGGFHRYSTDPRWLVPHFEKMLYDNALLVPGYIEAFQITGDKRHKKVAQHVLAYVAREMRAPGGGFFSATDADSVGPDGEREEGYYFTWTPDELREILGVDRAKVAQAYWGVTSGGNFEGRSILHVTRPLSEIAAKEKLSLPEAELIVEEAREALYQARQKRPAPATDNKVLVAWNGLMISAYAQAARSFGPDVKRDLDYLAIAAKAAEFILKEMRVEGRLLRSYQGGKAHLKAYVEDYAFFIAGLLDLYMASGATHWLSSAIELQAKLDLHYADTDAGAYFMTADDHERLLTREKPAKDGAIPSGNSYAIANLQRLFELTSDTQYRDRAEAGFRAFGQTLKRGPTGLSELLLALDYRVSAVQQIVIVTPSGGDAGAFRKIVAEHFLPNQIYVETEEGEPLESLAKMIPLLKSKIAIAGQVTAYVCQDSHCELPTGDVEVFRKQLGL